MKAFLAALQFLTTIPVRSEFDAHTISRSLLYFPLVGFIIGLLLVLVASLLGDHLLATALLLTAWVLLTGGLHLDGLADSADAWAAGRGDRERALAVMQDPRCGPFAIVVVVLLLLTRFAALATLAADDTLLLAALLMAPMAGRTAVLILYATTPCARQSGLAIIYAQDFDRPVILAITGGIALLCVMTVGWWALVITAGSLALLRWLLIQQFGGLTGDGLGGAIEVVETVVLIGAVIGLG